MVWTRLRGPLSRSSRWQRSPLYSSALSTRQLSISTPNVSFVQEAAPKKPKDKNKEQKTVKNFTDLPSVYVSANGVAATPLPEWNPDYIVPPPPVDSGVVHVYV